MVNRPVGYTRKQMCLPVWKGAKADKCNAFGWLFTVEFFIGCKRQVFLTAAKEGKTRSRRWTINY
jgi:hypothetical protein